VAIEQYERSIGAPLEEFIKSDEFADSAAGAAKKQAQIQRDIEAGTTEWLHAMNLPTATDMAELRAEIAELRKEVRSLAQAVAPAAQEAPSSAKPAANRTQPAKGPAKSE
jgi:hypothetical protein